MITLTLLVNFLAQLIILNFYIFIVWGCSENTARIARTKPQAVKYIVLRERHIAKFKKNIKFDIVLRRFILLMKTIYSYKNINVSALVWAFFSNYKKTRILVNNNSQIRPQIQTLQNCLPDTYFKIFYLKLQVNWEKYVKILRSKIRKKKAQVCGLIKIHKQHFFPSALVSSCGSPINN